MEEISDLKDPLEKIKQLGGVIFKQKHELQI